MKLPDYLRAHLKALAESDESPDAEVAALADELTDFVGSPEGFVPRAVLLAKARQFATDLVEEGLKGYRAELDALETPPAWFVLADWGRMTEAELNAAHALMFPAQQEMARRRNRPVAALVAGITGERQSGIDALQAMRRQMEATFAAVSASLAEDRQVSG